MGVAGAVRFRPDTISEGGGGGGGCCPLKARYEKRTGGGGGGLLSGASGPIQKAGRGCLAEEGVVPYMKGGVATPNPPPWIRLCTGCLCALSSRPKRRPLVETPQHVIVTYRMFVRT